MYHQTHQFRQSGGAPAHPQYPPQNLNFYQQNPNFYTQNPNFSSSQNPNIYTQNPSFSSPPNPYLQNPNFSHQQFSNTRFQPHHVSPKPTEILKKIESAVSIAHRELLTSGESVSAWKVSQKVLVYLQVDSWSSLGFQFQDVPSLNRLIVTEGKVNAFIHCFVGVRRITSLYDLDVEICKNEGVECFEELGLGPLVRHPLVQHYFLVPSDNTEIFKITSEEIISCLADYMGTCTDKDIWAEEFLDFLAIKQSVAVREKLGVRIQSLGMHIASIREARKAESAAFQKYLQSLKQTFNQRIRKEEKGLSQQRIHSQQQILDGRFNSISERVKSFSSLCGDFSGKHIRFSSSSSEDESGDDIDNEDDDDNDEVENRSSGQHRNASQNKKNGDHRNSSCPYPSQTEEMARLGQKVEMDGKTSPSSDNLGWYEGNSSSGKKRKLENQIGNLSSYQQFLKKGKVELDHLSRKDNRDKKIFKNSKEKKQNLQTQHANAGSKFSGHKNLPGDGDCLEKGGGLVLPSKTMEEFITTWKEACREHTVVEVFDRMLQFYKATGQHSRKMQSIFSVYPAVGLLNVAVTSIKCGMWDSLYDTFQTFGGHEFISPSAALPTEMIDVGSSCKIDALSNNNESIPEIVYSVTVDDIIKKVATYFEISHVTDGERKLPLEKHIATFRKFHECEIWLAKQFSVKEFRSLGCGNFFEFLEKHVTLLPHELRRSLIGDLPEKPALEVSMLHHQLLVLLSQAVSDDGLITKQHISVLLKKQFPMINFQITGDDPEGELLDLIRRQKCSGGSCRVMFSLALSRTCYIGDSLMHSDNHTPEIARLMTEVDPGAGSFGSVSGKDAIECLLKAPMLSDLLSWSHWELIYAPSLGPLMEWLLNEGHIKELSCMVTREGKVIRIDHMATVDEFLEASLQGSAFQTAVKLLSLLALYGGKNHVPLSLLKCHAQRAIEVIITNSMDTIEVNKRKELFMEGKALRGQVKLDIGSDSESIPVRTVDTMVTVAKNHKFCETLSRMDRAVAVASRFILDCLGYLPSEFRSFGADVLLSGLRSFSKDAPLVILYECNHIDQRLMLHDIGLSLGILEWIEDYQAFTSATAADLFVCSGSRTNPSKAVYPAFSMDLKLKPDTSQYLFSTDGKMMVNNEAGNNHDEAFIKAHERKLQNEVSTEKSGNEHCPPSPIDNQHQDATLIIDSIRREEFGLDSNLKHAENSLLKKQHARLGRALHCLSQELYSQDSHFLLELVQNADDNIYPENVDATLVFILQAEGIVVLNNEQGFSAQNIRALCDVGNSTKKGSSAGYIGQKGIGFKSVFRVTDAPEIHSNGFHVKFDMSEGEIGFVLPTVVSPCDINLFRRHLSSEVDQTDTTCWNTCIVLPFKSKIIEGTGVSSIMSMFSDLHPSLLLFLHRLQCIKFKNMLNDSLIIMRREIMGDGIIKVSHGKEKMSWLVASQKLQASSLRPDVQTTEIAIAFTLEESSNGEYKAHLDQQPVFAFLPLRTYGLKFILQGDFVLPSSREEVDGDSAWNQWLLSEFPSLFVSAERSFASLPCFQERPGKAVTAFMSFVPLVGEVYGFFSHLPRMIISKLRMSNCMLLEGTDMEWVPPCRVLRGWDEQTRILLPESLLHQHLGLGYLNKDIILSDPLAKTLGVQDYGPKILTEIITSICHTTDGIKAMGLDWLSSWLSALYTTLSAHSAGHLASLNTGIEFDVINNLRKIPFISLSDGSYGSLVEGPIWLPCDAFRIGFEGEDSPKDFPSMYAKLRTVNPLLLSTKSVNTYCMEETRTDNLIRMLHRVGVQRLSAHDVIKSHIFPAISGNNITGQDKNLMTEYLAFVMLHLQSTCPNCHIERSDIISELRKKPVVLTNHGYKCLTEESIHFSNEFGNPVNINKLIDDEDSKWHEVDSVYLKHPSTQRLSFALKNWREFFQELGMTDFVQIIHVEKNVAVVSNESFSNIMSNGELSLTRQVVKDWESPELVHLLCTLSSQKKREKCKYLLEVLDKMWDDCFSSKVRSNFVFASIEDSKPFQSSFIKSIQDFQWIASSMDEELHYPKDLFYDCEAVRSILGPFAPYSVPQVRSKMCLNEIGFKTQITFDDALTILNTWRTSGTHFRASIAQMNKFYTFIWNEISTSKRKLSQEIRSGPSIFVPFPNKLRHEDLVTGKFLSPNEVYWHDPTGCVDRTKELILQDAPINEFTSPPCKTLAHLYPNLHDFFVIEYGIDEIPPFASYLQILLQLSNIALPSQAADAVFRVILRWATDIGSGFKSEDIFNLKEYLLKLENAVLPSLQDKWVSLHPNFGLVCWCDDEELRKHFKHSDNVDFLHFGELSNEEKEMLTAKVSVLMQRIGVPALSEVVSREAIFYGTEDCGEKASLIDWVLPYAQRYIYKLHPDTYACLKKIGFENLSLRVVVVENLYYRNTLKGCGTTSKKRYECSCLLQGNIFYMTKASDSHSLFLELSRLFFNGSAELQLANFLHMITTMAESGSSEEQTEFFIINSQKVPMLPEEEAIWSLPCLSPIQEDNPLQPICDPPTEKNPSKSKRTNSNWPPTSWKTAPDFRFARANHFRTRPGAPPSGSISQKESDGSRGTTHMEDQMLSTEIDGDWIIQDNSATTMVLALESSTTIKDQPLLMRFSSSVNKQINSCLEPSDSVTASSPYLGLPTVTEREQLCLGTPNENQAYKTGRLGEFIAKKYFSEKFGLAAVKWVNEEMETGLPYDIIIGETEERREYVEVKSTKSSRKDWFMITTREWQFAAERGDSFSIAHIVLADGKNAKITVFKNPVKLCSQNMLHLAVLMPR